tara:strand:- start:15513 stop:15992 length:480 start_codon:yes stop_codon:yes gene_type:complete
MRASDIPHADRIGEIVHPDFPEDIAVMKNRFALFPAGCFIAEQAETVFGYAISHPSRIGRPAPLNHVLKDLDDFPDCLFLHDVALTASSRGLGLGKSIVPHLVATARDYGFQSVGLVSVNNSRDFWLAQGFRIFEGDDLLAKKLATYEDAARYMLLDVV